MNPSSKGDRATLAAIARQAMIDRGHVKLVHTDVERGFIDFVRD